MQIAFGRVRPKTAPTGLGVARVISSKIDTYGSVRNRTYRTWGTETVVFSKIDTYGTLQNRTYRAWV